MRYASLLIVLLACSSCPVFAQAGKTAKPHYKIDQDGGRVVCLAGKANVGWTTSLKGDLGGVRPANLVWDAQRVYVSHNDGVTALNAETGRLLWHAKGPRNCLLVSGDLLLAAEGRLVYGRAAASGAMLFKIQLPVRSLVTLPMVAAALRGDIPWSTLEALEAIRFDPEPIEEVAGLFLIQGGRKALGNGAAFLLDRRGRIRNKFNRQVIAGVRSGKDRVLLTSSGAVASTPDDKLRWSIHFEENAWMEDWYLGGGLRRLPGGDLLAFRYSLIDDSGVDLIRLTPSTGKVVWTAQCADLGIEECEGEYYHEAVVAVEGKRIRVTSRGSDGTFVELLDLQTGKKLKRALSKN